MGGPSYLRTAAPVDWRAGTMEPRAVRYLVTGVALAFVFVFLVLPLIVGCATEESFEGGDLEDVADSGWDAKADGARIAVTASSVEALNRNLSSLTPPCCRISTTAFRPISRSARKQ